MALQKKQWRVLGYLAGDNNLAGAALTDINEMEAVGSTREIDVLVQIDHAADYDTGNDKWRSTRRYHITKGKRKTKIESTLLQDLGETNSGDPKVICDFVQKMIHDYPAERTMLVLWNHGSGFYVPEGFLDTDRGITTREITTRAAPALKRSFFSTSRREVLQKESPRERGICYDDASMDCLDNAELKDILRFTQDRLGGRKLDVLGMDACLMTMIEMAYQVKDYAKFLVGSEESEPANGWPYDKVLADLAARPEMEGADLAKVIVKRYAASYGGEKSKENVTQAAIDLSKLDDLVKSIETLSAALLAAPLTKPLRNAVWLARRDATSFYDDLYVDIHDFAANLIENVEVAGIKAAAAGVMHAIEGHGATTPIIAEQHAGPDMGRVKGLSIYWPLSKQASSYYAKMDFAKATRWGDVLKTYGATRG